MDSWDWTWLRMARKFALERSKDPSTKVGAVVAKNKQCLGIGYNGFPPGLADLPQRLNNRAYKHAHTIHAEDNALWWAGRENTPGATIYIWPYPPCLNPCGLHIVRAGIIRVVCLTIPKDPVWQTVMRKARVMFQERRITVEEVTLTEGEHLDA